MARTVSFRIGESFLKAVDAAVKRDQRCRSEVIREALELWLRSRTLEEKIRRHQEGYKRHPVTPDEFEPILRTQGSPE